MNLLRLLGWPSLAGLLLALAFIQYNPHWVGLAEPLFSLPRSAHGGLYSYANAVDIAAPAVANLYTAKLISQTPQSPNSSSEQRRESSLGSAVIMSTEGYLLTNYHVTANADQIVVALKDGRETQATVIGSDPETDLAVLKIELDDLPAIPWGRSDQVRTGDVALAIGNPFGVGQTVTMGIISATGRNQLGLNTYEDFIQTDAAINRGNSGGALVDARGRLIGINAAIISETGTSQGIGFAIPIKLAVGVMHAIIQHGQVIRGWLGVEVQTVTPNLAAALGLSQPGGIVVSGVYPDGPADQAGLRPGDLILDIQGTPATDGHTSMNQVARTRPGNTLDIRILRNEQALTLTAEVGLRPWVGMDNPTP